MCRLYVFIVYLLCRLCVAIVQLLCTYYVDFMQLLCRLCNVDLVSGRNIVLCTKEKVKRFSQFFLCRFCVFIVFILCIYCVDYVQIRNVSLVSGRNIVTHVKRKVNNNLKKIQKKQRKIFCIYFVIRVDYFAQVWYHQTDTLFVPHGLCYVLCYVLYYKEYYKKSFSNIEKPIDTLLKIAIMNNVS